MRSGIMTLLALVAMIAFAPGEAFASGCGNVNHTADPVTYICHTADGNCDWKKGVREKRREWIGTVCANPDLPFPDESSFSCSGGHDIDCYITNQAYTKDGHDGYRCKCCNNEKKFDTTRNVDMKLQCLPKAAEQAATN
ncbi:hypothetical protein [Bauldia sp.]|uniref:hypothetical protein n=1 Tax=Bauldia sp. TaxID=2575872 RepID=UPI003BAC479D